MLLLQACMPGRACLGRLGWLACVQKGGGGHHAGGCVPDQMWLDAPAELVCERWLLQHLGLVGSWHPYGPDCAWMAVREGLDAGPAHNCRVALLRRRRDYANTATLLGGAMHHCYCFLPCSSGQMPHTLHISPALLLSDLEQISP